MNHFGLLTLLIVRGFYNQGKKSIPLTKIGLIASGYGLLIEVYQDIRNHEPTAMNSYCLC